MIPLFLLKVLPEGWKWVAAAVAAAALFGFGWVKGNEHGTEKLITYQQKQFKESERVKQRQRLVTERLIVQYVDKVRVIKEKGDVVEKLVPTFVTQRADAGCAITAGARVLHDAAATGAVPGSAGADNDAPTSLTLSTTLSVVAKNYTTYHEVAARLTACQDWIADQYEATNGRKYQWPTSN